MKYLPIIALMLLACGSKRTLMQETAQVSPAPMWVESKPISSLYYIGIGKSRKSSSDHALLAKRSALADLASEIEVSVDAQSVLYTLEHDDRFDERFSEVVFLNTKLDLEGFEAYDAYETKDEYWVYYKLNKARYAEIVAERKRLAIELADGHLSQALKAFERADAVMAAHHSIESLTALEHCWGEVNSSPNFDNLGLKAIDLLSRLRADLDIGMPLSTIVLDETNGFVRQVHGELKYGDTVLQPIPVLLKHEDETQKFEGSKFQFTLKPSLSQTSELLVIIDPFFAEREKRRSRSFDFLDELLKPIEHRVMVSTKFPSISLAVIQGREGDLLRQNRELEASIVNQLADVGIRADGNGKNRFEILVMATTRDAGLSMGQQVAYTKAIITLKDNELNEVRSKFVINEVKGVHRDMENAELVSLKKLKQKFDKSFLEALIGGLF